MGNERVVFSLLEFCVIAREEAATIPINMALCENVTTPVIGKHWSL